MRLSAGGAPAPAAAKPHAQIRPERAALSALSMSPVPGSMSTGIVHLPGAVQAVGADVAASFVPIGSATMAPPAPAATTPVAQTRLLPAAAEATPQPQSVSAAERERAMRLIAWAQHHTGRAGNLLATPSPVPAPRVVAAAGAAFGAAVAVESATSPISDDASSPSPSGARRRFRSATSDRAAHSAAVAAARRHSPPSVAGPIASAQPVNAAAAPIASAVPAGMACCVDGLLQRCLALDSTRTSSVPTGDFLDALAEALAQRRVQGTHRGGAGRRDGAAANAPASGEDRADAAAAVRNFQASDGAAAMLHVTRQGRVPYFHFASWVLTVAA
jgi:hypothetical protein